MNFKKISKYKLILSLILLFNYVHFSQAEEINIISKIDNEIITNIDIENEYRYLVILNKSLRDIEKNKMLEYAKESLIKEKVKKNEISKFYELKNKNETVDLMIKNIYQKLGINNLSDFKEYLKKNNLDFNFVYQKIEIESVWNQMIYSKFKNKIIIDEEDLKNKIKNDQTKSEALLISEIVIGIDNKNQIQEKYNLLLKNIDENGFKDSVLKFSISESKNNSGELGWVNKNNLSKEIQKALSDVKIGNITKPILISSGILILKLEDRKFVEIEKNLDDQLEKLINFEMNNQLNNFSTIYYNKIKKNLSINVY